MKEKMKVNFFLKNVSEHPNLPDELAQNVSKKKKSSQVPVYPIRNDTGDVMPLAQAITQLSFLEFLQRCGVPLAPPQPSSVTSSYLTPGCCCADDSTL